MKARQRFKIFWVAAVTVAVLAMAYLIIPPLLPMARLRPDFESAVSKMVGVPVKIDGDIKLSLLGYPMIALEDVRFGEYKIKAARFRVSWSSIFNLKNARIISGIKIQGLRTEINAVSPPNFGTKIMISDSVIKHYGKEYEIIDAVLDAGKFSAMIRTDQHKYNLHLDSGEFVVTNPNLGLTINGKLLSDNVGNIAAKGKFEINVSDINRWFDFDFPKIPGQTKIAMDFEWDGGENFDFSKIRGNNGKASFNGHIILSPGKKIVRMKADNMDLDLSDLLENIKFIRNSEFNIDISGNITTPVSEMKKLRALSIHAVSDSDSIDIKRFRMGDGKSAISATGKIIGKNAVNLDVAFSDNARSVRCMFSGNRDVWNCSRFSFAHKNIAATGTLNVGENNFQMMIHSKSAAAGGLRLLDDIRKYFKNRDGKIDFEIGETIGNAVFVGQNRHVEYIEKNAVLGNLGLSLPLPTIMLEARGNIAAVVENDKMSFVFQAPNWTFALSDAGEFSLNHKDARELLSALTTQDVLSFIKPNLSIVITGNHNGDIITDLVIGVGNDKFSGTLIGNSITLDTVVLDMNRILDDKWFDAFIDNQYLYGDPILAPFDFNAKIAINAENIKIGSSSYQGFIYYMDGARQYMSITDSENGKLLLTISKDMMKYKYLLQADKFFVSGNLFAEKSPLNIEGATITARAELESFGITAYDIRRNMAGPMDVSIDGGFLIGLGTDKFYDNANRIEKRDAENAIHATLMSGHTAIKEMSITGEYSGGDFHTTRPFMMTARHTDITGNFAIRDAGLWIMANIILRGTNAIPKPITLGIRDNMREYSISDILPNIDLDYLREFTSTHGKF